MAIRRQPLWRTTLAAVLALALAAATATTARGDGGGSREGQNGPPSAELPVAERPPSGLIVNVAPAGGSIAAAAEAGEAQLERRAAQLKELAERLPGSAARIVPELGALVIDLPPALEAIPRARAAARVQRILERIAPNASVELDRRVELRRHPNDFGYQMADPRAPSFARGQWNLRRQGFPKAWNRSIGGRARIAVIDSGVDASHPDLAPRIQRSFAIGTNSPGVDEEGHGTHVAGMACANGNNRIGIAGAAYRCRLLTYKVDMTFSAISVAIRDAARRGVDVINMSLGGEGGSDMLRRAIGFAYRKEVVIVAAAANRSVVDQGVPARYLQPSGTGRRINQGRGLVVTAAGADGRRAYFGPGHGSQISVAAYGAGTRGMGLLSTFPGNNTAYDGILFRCDCRVFLQGDDRYAYLEGTSMAAPQVAGLAALLRARRPNMRARVVNRVIKRTARNDRWRGGLGWGIIRADRALRRADRIRNRNR